MFQTVPQAGPAPAADLREAVTRQREMLTELLTVAPFKAARRLAPLVDIRHALELLLIDEIEQLRHCRCLYVLDAGGRQITASIGRDGVERRDYGRNRAACAYLQGIIGVSDFRLSEVYRSGDRDSRPLITAIQVLRDRAMKRIGFLGADFDLRELPHTGAYCRELQRWRQPGDDTARHGGLCGLRRQDSLVDRRVGDVLGLFHDLLSGRGVFHGELHFSGYRATLWLTGDPFRYRVLGIDELCNPDTRLAYPRRPYPDTARVPADCLPAVLEQLRRLRYADEYVYLRSGSLNLFNGAVGLSFSCTGPHYIDYREFLEKDAQFWSGMRCAV